MSLYTILMVDDEEEVIQIIRRKIDWEQLGFLVVGQARNGIEALEMVEEFQPDVVMTDIKMPYMDGLEFAKQLKKKYSDIHVIILSGFDEFDYAKQAIELEVEEYLLKPIDSAEIRKVFQKMKNSLDSARDFRNNLNHLENYYQKTLPILQEGILSSLMEHDIITDQLKEYLEEYRISFTGDYYAVSIIHTSLTNIPDSMSPRLLQLSVRQLVEQSVICKRNSYIFNFRNNLVAVTSFDSMEEISLYTDECDRICKSAKRNLQAMITIGIGMVVTDLENIVSSYDSAREAISYRKIYGAGSAINISEIEPGTDYIESNPGDHLNDIFKEIKMGTEESLESSINIYFSRLTDKYIDLKTLNYLIMELLSAYYRFLVNNNISVNVLNKENDSIYEYILHMDSMDEIKRWLLRLSLDVRKIIQEERMNKSNSLVHSAQQYVLANYHNTELSIDLVCSELGVSSSYFSTIFKKETGQTFIQYLTEYRMKEAERLLLEEDEKKYIIAEKVGYSDPSYFSYVFKKWFGMSPVKYKNKRNQM